MKTTLKQCGSWMAAALFALLGGAAFPGGARADVKLPALFTDNMVLQRDRADRIFGKADPGEAVTVEIAGKKGNTTAGPDGRWLVTMNAMPPVGGPYTLTVQGKNTVTVNNVLVGEVWLCSGQSNMELALKTSFEPQAAIAASADTNIRLFQVKNTRSDTPLDDVQAKWQECGPETVPNFSAVAFYFARDLRKALGVPVGLIQSDWGGTPAEAWTREAVLTGNPELKGIVDAYPASRERYEKSLADYPAAVERAKADGKPAPRRPAPPWRYSELYNGMIAPLAHFDIRGVLWYQGESNAGRAAQYRTLFPAMIQSWRDDFGVGGCPFLLVQLAPYSAGNSVGTNYAELREAQFDATRRLPLVGMAVITDVGEENDIHPKHKEPVGARLALLALRFAYGKPVAADSPTFIGMRVEGGKAILTFDRVAGGLVAKGGIISGREVAEGTLVGFAVAGEDGKFVPAQAKITGKDIVEVSAPEVPKPVAVRYGFVNFPVVNLFNDAGLPATPFRTDAPK